jgi:hypothetical protein
MSNFVKSIKSPHKFNGENAVSFILCTKGRLGAYFYNKTKLRAAFFDLQLSFSPPLRLRPPPPPLRGRPAA